MTRRDFTNELRIGIVLHTILRQLPLRPQDSPFLQIWVILANLAPSTSTDFVVRLEFY